MRRLLSVMLLAGVWLLWTGPIRAAEEKKSTGSEWDILLEGKGAGQPDVVPPGPPPGERPARPPVPPPGEMAPPPGPEPHEGMMPPPAPDGGPSPGDNELGPQPPGGGPQIMRERMRQRMLERGQGMGPGQGRRGGMGQGQGMGMGPDGGPLDRARFGRMDPEELLTFLHKHEPTLADKLETMRSEDPQKFRVRLPLLGRVYGPVMEQMKYDPTMAQLSLQKIRLRLQAEKAAQDVKGVSDANAQKTAKEQLRESVGKLYDVIMQQENLRQQRWEEHLKKFTETQSGVAEANQPPPGGPEEEAAPPPLAGPRAKQRIERLRQEMDRHKQTMQSWRDSKDQIVNSRIEQLLQGPRPFPWD